MSDEIEVEEQELEEQEALPEPSEAEAAQAEVDKKAAEDEKRRVHEEAEAKRKAEWEATQKAKKEAYQKAVAELDAMGDIDVKGASVKRIGTDLERLTRRNMKQCVAQYLQSMCKYDPAFARLIMHPRKSMINCFRYINRKAREYLEQEMKDNDEKPDGNGIGGDVPDDLCLQWAVDYFNDPDAQEDSEKEEKFVPRPYYGGSTSKAKKKEPKPKEPKKPTKPSAPEQEQMSLFGEAVTAVA